MISDIFATWFSWQDDDGFDSASFTVYGDGKTDATAHIAIAQYYGIGNAAWIHAYHSASKGVTTYSRGERSDVNRIPKLKSVTFMLSGYSVYAPIMIYFH